MAGKSKIKIADKNVLNAIKRIKSLRNIGDILSKEHRTLVEDVNSVMNTYKGVVETTETLGNVYRDLISVANRHWDVKDRFFDAYKTLLQSDRNNPGSLGVAYDSLRETIRKRQKLEMSTELESQIVDMLKIGIQSEKNDAGSLNYAYNALGQVVMHVDIPQELVTKIIDTLKIGMQKNAGTSLNGPLNTYFSLLSNFSNRLRYEPKLAEEIMDAIDSGMQVIQLDENRNDLIGVIGSGTESRYEYALRYAFSTLNSVTEARPDLTDQIFKVLNKGLQPTKRHAVSLRNSYEILGKIIDNADQDLSNQVFEVIRTDLKTQENDSYSVKEVYSILKRVVEKKPELTDQVVATIEAIMQSQSNENDIRYPKIAGTERDSLFKEGYDMLNDIAKTQPKLVVPVVKAIKEGVKSSNTNRENSSTKRACRCLESIIEEKQFWDLSSELQMEIIDAYEMILQSKYGGEALIALKNIINTQGIQQEEQSKLIQRIFQAVESGWEKGFYYNSFGGWLKDIVEARPDLTEYAFETIGTCLQSGNNLSDAYTTLSDIVRAQPDLAEQVFETLKIGLQSDKNDGNSLSNAYTTLSDIVRAQPDLAEQVFETLKIGLQSDKNNEGSLGRAYTSLSDIVRAQPDLAKQVLEIFKIGMQSDKNDGNSLCNAYTTLVDIVGAQPDLAKQVLEIFKIGMQSDKNNGGSLGRAYTSLSDIVRVQPDLAKQVLEIFKIGMQSDKNDGGSLGGYNMGAYTTLSDIVRAQPDLAGQVFETLKIGLQSDKNDGNSLCLAYTTLRDIVRSRPDLAEQVFETLKIELQSDKNNGISLFRAYTTLSDIVEAKPRLLEDVLKVYKTVLESEKNNSHSLSCAYDSLHDIIRKRPDLAKQIFEITVNNKESPDKIYVYKAFIDGAFKRVASFDSFLSQEYIKNIINEHPDIEKDLHIAFNGRLVTDEIFRHAMESDYIDKKLLINPDLFKNQPYAMKVLEKTFEKEDGIDSKESRDYDLLISTSFKFTAFTQKRFVDDYIRKVLTYNKRNPENKISIHNAVYWLPNPMSREASDHFAQFILREGVLFHIKSVTNNADNDDNIDNGDNTNAEKEVFRPIEELSIIAQSWGSLEYRLKEQNRDITKLSYEEILDICKSTQYKNQRSDSFAMEAVRHSIPEEIYPKYEDIYLTGLNVPEPFDNKKRFEVEGGKYVGRFLPREDPRVGFFGCYTGCCQVFGNDGNGGPCAVSSVKDPCSQLFVIEDKNGEIIAGSWVWENVKDGYREVCFDNIEVKEPNNPTEAEKEALKKRRRKIREIYDQVGKYLITEENCRQVVIGVRYSDDADLKGYGPPETPTLLPELYIKRYQKNKKFLPYSDAINRDGIAMQVVSAIKTDAKPLTEEQRKKLRYIRKVGPLDVEEMQKVSSEVFPESDKELQVPDNMEGFVIEDRENGVVGYCLYYRKEKSIYDMAVIPEYKTDGDISSSVKLLEEVLKVIKEEGGEWKAEMRDTTTLKLMKFKARHGEFRYREDGEDHVMSDGSKAINVVFEPIEKDTNGLKGMVGSLTQKEEEGNGTSGVGPAGMGGAGPMLPGGAGR
ncbi:MAG: hypothetical protein J6Y03_00100 [Alphaproteobacteria bacterium]|nr:hypothetical protein [Alphaproteobacteria bacterium]